MGVEDSARAQVSELVKSRLDCRNRIACTLKLTDSDVPCHVAVRVDFEQQSRLLIGQPGRIVRRPGKRGEDRVLREQLSRGAVALRDGEMDTGTDQKQRGAARNSACSKDATARSCARSMGVEGGVDDVSSECLDDRVTAAHG